MKGILATTVSRIATNSLIGAFFLVAATSGTSGAQTRIAEIEVQGELRRVAESLILSTIGLTPGVELSQENVQEAIRSLHGLNVFKDIQLWAEEIANGDVKLVVVVDEYPALEGIRFKGHKKMKEKEMKEALGLVIGQVIAPKDIARGRQKILDMYVDKGYLRAEVSGKLFDAEDEGEVYLHYDVEEGEKVKVRKINILNSNALSAGKVRKQMGTKENRWWRKNEFKSDTYEEDKTKILALYRSEGYQQATIVRDSVYYDESRQNLFIDLEIDEGRQYRLGKVVWNGNELLGDAALQSRVAAKEGDVYKFSTPELAYLAKSAYYEMGYLDTEVLPVETIRGDSIDVEFQVFEGEPFRIRRIDIQGNVKTREKVLRREIELRPGSIYQQSALEESQRRLYMLGFFKDVQVRDQASAVEGDKSIDLVFQVEEQRTGAVSMGAGFSDRDKLVGTLGLQIPNLRGTGQNLDFNWEFGSRREQFLIGFTEPWLLDTPTSLSARIFTLKQQYFNNFHFKRNSVSIRLGRRLRWPAYSTLSVGYELRDEHYSDFNNPDQASSASFSPRTTSSLDVSFRRDTRDFPQFPTRGTVFSYKPQFATSAVGGDVDFHRHEVVFHYYRPSWWKFVLALETKTSVIDGFSKWDDENLSFWDRFTPGGVDLWDGQVRGYPDASLGPRRNGANFGGRAMMTINLEYRFPITEQQVVGLLFADAGNAWAAIAGMDPTDMRRSVGLGFRVNTPMLGMIGFDFGYGFDRGKVDGQPAQVTTHFQFGPRFF
jgi:outer membrane protein insertion porin family